MPIPWLTILKQAPVLLAAADSLLSSTRRNAAARGATDAQALQQRLAAIEDHQNAQAELTRQIADQVNALGVAAQTNARTSRLALRLAVAATVLAAAACLIAWVT